MKIILAIVIMALCFLFILCIALYERHNHTDYERNYQVRFDPEKEKYYIVNRVEQEDMDIPVLSSWGFKILYDNVAKAEYVCNTLNGK